LTQASRSTSATAAQQQPQCRRVIADDLIVKRNDADRDLARARLRSKAAQFAGHHGQCAFQLPARYTGTQPGDQPEEADVSFDASRLRLDDRNCELGIPDRKHE
jgi:hypothetical protein